MLYNLSNCIRLCILLIVVNPQKSGETPKRWRNFCIDNAFKELSLLSRKKDCEVLYLN